MGQPRQTTRWGQQVMRRGGGSFRLTFRDREGLGGGRGGGERRGGPRAFPPGREGWGRRGGSPGAGPGVTRARAEREALVPPRGAAGGPGGETGKCQQPAARAPAGGTSQQRRREQRRRAGVGSGVGQAYSLLLAVEARPVGEPRRR